MGQLKFGFVIADTTSSQVMVAEQTLRMLADVEGEIERRIVPGTAETVLAAKCFAELTSVDAVLVFLPKNDNPLVVAAALEGLTDIVLDWNMPVVTTLSYPEGVSLAQAAVAMVDMQIEMEARAAENTVDTRVN
jgi:6,7-dimethyl-8-ribityllumazine synthase